ncbi:ABC transporter substrate-binding protein [Paraoerskovia marina]|uniref:ABC transporter substrate-binding protein n=1 Tax=Paraoerskovia marina TaxID=545619 RepID=UPI000492BC6E|nr:ABC transporter substrate-binding protein [Paraoerskovia marina]
MKRRTLATRSLALAAALSLGLAACSTDDGGDSADGGGDSGGGDDQLVVGTLLPLTGTLAFLGPPEVAGVGLAVDEINEAGGVLGNDVTIEGADSGDSTDFNVSTQSATDLIGKDADVMIGAASSSVSLNVVDMVTEAGVMQISPANTSTTLSGYSDLFARTAPPDSVQGSALGSLILDSGATKVGFLVQNEDYGTGLRDNVQQTIEAGGAEAVYGGTGAGQEFQPGESNFSAQVTDLLAQDPDVISVIAFDETKAIVTELVAQGWDLGGKTFFCDGNTASYEGDFDEGTLEGVIGTIPGAEAKGEFKERLDAFYADSEGGELTSYAYGPESYDATILAALAAVRGGSADGQTIADNIKSVSGADGGTEVSSFAEGVEALEAGDDIHYVGVSGTGPLNDDNDPSSAFIGVYEYDSSNVQNFTRAVEGQIG